MNIEYVEKPAVKAKGKTKRVTCMNLLIISTLHFWTKAIFKIIPNGKAFNRKKDGLDK